MFISKKISLLSYLNRQNGQVLIIALILIALLALMIPPLMSFMSSGLKQGTALEDRTNQLYIADAGIETACKNILAGKLNDRDEDGIWDFIDVDGNDYSQWQYTLNNINEYSSNVLITVRLLAGTTQGQNYLVTSIGQDSKGGETRIEATIRAEIGQYYGFLNNISTTMGGVDVQGSGTVVLDGIVQSGEDTNHDGVVDENDINATFTSGGYGGPYEGIWPTEEELRNYYGSQIVPGSPNYFPSGLEIDTDSTLSESIYVIGECKISANVTLGANIAIFVDGNIISKPNKTVTGPGVIAATGDVQLWPNESSGNEGEGLFVFSLGELDFHPSNTFYGWAIGKESIHIYQGSGPSFNWVDPNDPYVLNILNFPGLLSPGPSFPTGRVAIMNWNVSPQ
jgi:hypothetical protein